ncbi:hypothetical protein PFLUV_G00085210 [Perca fluviatilis]|uniref:Uncharacterized protein n=1 Tax=Perca fluviatilis TaxID=8168 RepID=A0A6A5F9E2_PERFL|nr:hypothetical protein PFLUV_G00085210 [Perca fluviatilis]
MPDVLRLGHNIGGMRFGRSHKPFSRQQQLFRSGQDRFMFGARPASHLDPIPASRTLLAGSEAAVPGICWDV